MPLSIDPNATFRIVLDSDKGKDPEPAFIYRYLTGEEWELLDRLSNEITDNLKNRDPQSGFGNMVNVSFEAVKIGLIGWKSMGSMPFGCENIKKLLTPIEAQEIVAKLIQQNFTPEDKKKLELPSASGLADSAKPLDLEPVPDAGRTYSEARD